MPGIIYKYELEHNITVIPDINLQKALHVNTQRGKLCLWAEVIPSIGEKVVIQVLGTGYGVPDNYEYIGTVMDGNFVWHIYHVRKTL